MMRNLIFLPSAATLVSYEEFAGSCRCAHEVRELQLDAIA
jgi:hypothetical protein